MRAIVALILLTVACGGAQQAATSASTQSQPDSGTPPVNSDPADSGTPADTTTPPASTTTPPADTTPPPDAGPGTIAEVACAATPQALWSRSFADSSLIDFHGVSDAQGNVYWVEYATSPFGGDPNPPSTLVSVDAAGNDRYRVTLNGPSGDFKAAGDNLVVANHGVVTAYAIATGAQSWSVDLSPYISSHGGGAGTPAGLLDLGTGRVAVALNDALGGVFVLDASTGALVANHVAFPAGFQMLATDGAGHALFSANHTSFEQGSSSFTTDDVYSMDDSGNLQWMELLENFGGVLTWTKGELPWIPNQNTTAAGHNFLGVPGLWSSAAATRGGVALFESEFFIRDSAGNVTFPLKADFVRDGVVQSSGLFPEINTFNSFSVFNFAGADHAAFVLQQFDALGGLCFPIAPGAHYLGRIDQSSAQLCPFSSTNISQVTAVTASAGNLVAGGTGVMSFSCENTKAPAFIIEAYARP
jgi:hypothetical protein